MNKKWMCHPSLPDQPIEVPESAVSVHAHSGWLLMDGPPAKPEDRPVPRATVHGEPYEDPSTDEKPKTVRRASTSKKEGDQ